MEFFGYKILVILAPRFFRVSRRGSNEQGSIHPYVTAARERRNAETRKKIKPKRLFGVIWSSE